MRLLVRDLPLKAAAVVMAMVMWVLAAQASVERIATIAFDGRVPLERPELPSGVVLRSALGDVAVRLRGPESSVLPRVTLADLRATADLGGIDAAAGGTFEVPIRVSAADPRVSVVEVAPATVTLRIERVTSRTIAVQARFANGPPAGSIAGDAVLAPREVTLTGPETLVASVTALLVTVRFGDAPLDVLQTAQPSPVDASGARVEGVALAPSAVEVRVPVLPAATTRTVPVVPSLRGSVAAGFAVTRVQVEPAAMTVRGSQERLAALDSLATAPFDVGDLERDRAATVALVLPEGVALVRPGGVTVRVTVVAQTGSRGFALGLVAKGTGEGLSVEYETRSVDVVIAGPQSALATLTAAQLAATIDVAGLAQGAHQVAVAVRAPDGLTVQAVQPARVPVTMVRK
ncbi:MAG: hypothetical protein FJ034_04515 [Chloroflexi bacterium]|nr:hypothetical protein [Chloroflexota bacterium]